MNKETKKAIIIHLLVMIAVDLAWYLGSTFYHWDFDAWTILKESENRAPIMLFWSMSHALTQGFLLMPPIDE